MRPRAVVVTSLLLLAGTSAVAATEPSIPYTEFTLPNGLRVILSEDHRAPQVAVDVWYHVGAANQSPGKSGFAHLFEHMMFSGSQARGPTRTRCWSASAPPRRAANGTTNFDRTNYFEVVPASQLPTALWLERTGWASFSTPWTRRSSPSSATWSATSGASATRTGPTARAQLELCDTLYPKPHPYYHCVIGSIEEIQAASVEDVQGLLPRVLHPRNASLAIVGDFDPKVARELVTRYFGDLPGGGNPKRPDVPQPKLDRVVEKTVPDPVSPDSAAPDGVERREALRPRRGGRGHPLGRARG